MRTHLTALIFATVVQAVVPQVKGTPKVVANVTDPSLTRDSCGSVKVGTRVLWVCRDTHGYNGSSGLDEGSFVPNSASWTDFDATGNLLLQTVPQGAGSTGENPVLLMYGGSYNLSDPQPWYPLELDECPPAGFCSDGTRFATWPAQPPMIAQTSANGTVIAYTWIVKHHLLTSGISPEYQNQGTSLYRFEYSPPLQDDIPAPPLATLVAENFWPQGAWGYGSLGTVVNNDTVYLYAQNDDRTQVALAKVSVSGIEDRSQYRYWLSGSWTPTMPAMNDTSAYIPPLASVSQGTFYYSDTFASYIYIGGAANVSNHGPARTVDFTISAAPSPEGPWTEPASFYTAPWGNSVTLGGYSIQAHASLIQDPLANRSIYLTYTQRNNPNTYGGSNVTPLIYVEFE